MSVLVEILLPTYKRADALHRNLTHLGDQIVDYHLLENFRIIVSDNASPDQTEEVVRQFKKSSPVQIDYFRQESNVGLEGNMVFILGKASAPFVLWTGDDDFVADGYLKFCIDKIHTLSDLHLIIPGLSSLHEDGMLTPGRPAAFAEKEFASGYETAWQLSHMAHQMSGLLMRREKLLENYLSKPEYRNPYLFIQLATQTMLNGQTVYAPGYPTSVTVFNEKDWGYNAIGLLDEVFKSYLFFRDRLSEEQITDLLVRFSVLHSYRYNIRWNKPGRLYRQYIQLLANTPALGTLRRKLATHLVKDYLKSFVK